MIIERVTSDGPDGRPWPPTESNVLWVIVARADGCTVCVQSSLLSPTLSRTLQFLEGQHATEKVMK